MATPPAGVLATKVAGGRGGSSLGQDAPSSNRRNFRSPPAFNGKEWSRQQKRGYHRLRSCLTYWQAHNYQVRWVTLTGADDSDAGKLSYHHQVLRQRIERGLGYPGIEHFQVRTSEGNGVLHIFWAWRAQDGFRNRLFYVPQDWLSRQWVDIHGATNVWIGAVGNRDRDTRRVSAYAMAQYVGEQSGYEYMSWSWGRIFGFPLAACWSWLKRSVRNRSRLLVWWARFLSGGLIIGVPGAGQAVSMGIIRQRYREWRAAGGSGGRWV